MTKSDMVDKIAGEAGISKAAAKAALDSLVTMCREEVKAGRAFRLSGLGTFSLKESQARQGVNPATKAPITIEAKKRMAFKMSAQVKDLLN
ncbi:MAG: HU family DNA-binding protein [Deltaproteobacteria bacterium]|nr:HU family DNA-binding protein [Deltaproteobacteria bacterium]